jgi:formiminotetrahydrofolate cyclodeaminase
MRDRGLEDWLDSLAAKQPTPGGGAAAGLALATAAALVGMVSIYTTGEKWAEHADRMHAIYDEAAQLRQRALELMVADEQAFAAVGAAYGLPKNDENERTARRTAIQTALAGAAEPPLQVARFATEVLELAEELVNKGNPNVISDVAVAGTFVRAALEAAIDNIGINERLVTDETVKSRLSDAILQAQVGVEKADVVVAAVRMRINK